MNIETEQAAAVSNKIPITKESTTIEKPTLSICVVVVSEPEALELSPFGQMLF